MVCLGNICRSPLAEGILQKMIDEKALDWKVDSCGTSGYHDGELPNIGSIQIADAHGLDIRYQRSRKFIPEDLDNFDLILAMDASNYQNIMRACRTDAHRDKIELILNYAYPGENRAVPDPYYEGGFDRVYDMIYKACEALVEQQAN